MIWALDIMSQEWSYSTSAYLFKMPHYKWLVLIICMVCCW